MSKKSHCFSPFADKVLGISRVAGLLCGKTLVTGRTLRIAKSQSKFSAAGSNVVEKGCTQARRVKAPWMPDCCTVEVAACIQ